MLPFGERVTTMELEAKGREEAAMIRGFAFGHGAGRNAAEARQAAAEDLAQQLLTHVRSEVRITERELRHEEARHHDSSLERELESSAASLANAALEGMVTDLQVQADDGWYVRLRVSQSRMDELRQRARRQAPALAQFELTSQEDDGLPGRRLRAALRGLAVVQRTGVFDEQVYHPTTGATTFGSYFQRVIVESVDALRVIPLVADGEVRFAVVHRDTLAPQPGLAIEVAGLPLRTGADGLTSGLPLDDLEAATPVLAVGYAEALGDGAEGEVWVHPSRGLLRVTTLAPDDWGDADTTEILVHTDPVGVLAAVNGDEQLTPARFLVPGGRSVHLEIVATDAYRGHTETLTPPEGAPYGYASVALTERRFGQLHIEAQGGQSRIRVTGTNGEWESRSNRFHQPVEVGRYNVTVHRDNGDDYQRIVESFTVLEDQTIQRRYAAPIYREPYSRGARGGISLLRLGGSPLTGYRLPWAFGEKLDFADFADHYGASENGLNIDLVGQGQRFFDRMNLTVQGEIGLRTRSFAIGDEDPDGDGVRDILMSTDDGDLSMSGFHLALGAGFWREAGRGTIWLTANQAFETMSWSEDSQVDVCRGTDANSGFFSSCNGERRSLPSSSVTTGSRYAEFGFSTGNGFTMALRIPQDTLGGHLMVGYGVQNIQRGYNHPASAQAARGVHY